MKCLRCTMMGLALLLGVSVLVWLGMTPATTRSLPDPAIAATPDQDIAAATLRIGLIPERDIYAQRKRYRALADYLGNELHRPVELLTVNSYEGVIQDFKEKRIDAAFLGSLVAVLANDQMKTQILVKPESAPNHKSDYRGVIFAPENSSIRSIEDLAGKSIAMVRTTMGGHLFGYYELSRAGLLGSPRSPKVIWVGTHDDVISEVVSGHADAGAVKDARLDDYVAANPAQKFRRLATSSSVPENALSTRADLDPQLVQRIREVLLKMDSTPQGQSALKEFGASRFLPCRIEEYQAIFDMVAALQDRWETKIGIPGPAPRLPQPLAQP